MRNRLWLLVLLAPLAACSTTSPATGDGAASNEATAPQCNPQVLQALVGKTASQAVIDQAVREAGAKSARVVKPGMAVTMDFREDRLTVNVDANNVIERAGCN